MRGSRGDRDSTGQRRAAPQWPRCLGDRDSESRVKQTCLQTCPVALHPPGFAANSGPGPREGVPSAHVQAVGAPDECPLCQSLVSALQNYKGGRARSLVSPITITTAAAVNSVTADVLLSACCVPGPLHLTLVQPWAADLQGTAGGCHAPSRGEPTFKPRPGPCLSMARTACAVPPPPSQGAGYPGWAGPALQAPLLQSRPDPGPISPGLPRRLWTPSSSGRGLG